jgi:streptomycin 6-kinase
LAEQYRRIAGSAEADADRVWRWAFVERVTTGLYLRWFGHPQQSASVLDTADLLAR